MCLDKHAYATICVYTHTHIHTYISTNISDYIRILLYTFIINQTSNKVGIKFEAIIIGNKDS
jgi:hypothetical protein